ncbi:MAG: 3-dehydroquinate synthase [Phycisphaerales bacterium]|nr:3-dehydroquinate synthase [Phycisphaerales bacterium]
MTRVETVRVELGERSYDAVIGAGVLKFLGRRTRTLLADAKRAFIARDAGVPERFVEIARESLAGEGFEVSIGTVAADERKKSLEACERLLVSMANARLERSDVVIALGGGMTGDVAGFAAASFKRGVAVVQCPTTLLAMVDASVGGKTGVNLVTGTGLTKNLVGAFWQPVLVLADVETLTTLTPRVFRAGWGEMLKHGLIAGAFDETLWDDTIAAVTVEPSAGVGLAALIARNVRLKAAIVAGDERETASSDAGGRALLNLGHTYAHAMEPIGHLSATGDPKDAPMEHGEAVALGLIAAAAAGQAAGSGSLAYVGRVRGAVESIGLRSRIGGLPDDSVLMGAMRHDKKASGGRMRIVTPVDGARDGFGARVVDEPGDDVIRAGWAAIRG